MDPGYPAEASVVMMVEHLGMDVIVEGSSSSSQC